MTISEQQIRRFMTDDSAMADMVDAAKRFGNELANNKLSTNQIRNAYGNMKKVQMLGYSAQTKRKLLMMKPRLAYAAGRSGGASVKPLSEVISSAVDHVNDPESFQRFCDFFEAIVAYHKAHGGK